MIEKYCYCFIQSILISELASEIAFLPSNTFHPASARSVLLTESFSFTPLKTPLTHLHTAWGLSGAELLIGSNFFQHIKETIISLTPRIIIPRKEIRAALTRSIGRVPVLCVCI